MEGVPDKVKVSGLKCNQAGSGLPATTAGFGGNERNETIHHLLCHKFSDNLPFNLAFQKERNLVIPTPDPDQLAVVGSYLANPCIYLQ